MVAGLEQRLRVLPQGAGAATRGVRSREPRCCLGRLAGTPIQLARGHRRVGAILQRQHLLVGVQRLLLLEHHEVGVPQQHPRVGVPGESHRPLLCRGQRAEPVLERAAQRHEGGIGLGEGGREAAGEPQPPRGATRGVALTSGRAPHREPGERGAEGSPHCLIMVLRPVRLQPRHG